MATTVTVPSGSNTSVPLSYGNAATASLATSLLSAVYTAAHAGTPTIFSSSSPSATSVAGAINEFIIASTVTGAVTVPSGFDTVLDLATGTVSLTGNKDAGEKIVSGDSTSLYFIGGTGSGTILGGTGSATVASGAFSVLGDTAYVSKDFTSGSVGTGSTVSVAAGGSVSVTGTGDTIYTSSGSVIYDTTGTSTTVVAGAGASTINASASGGFYYNPSAFLTYVGSVTSTIVAAASGTVVAYNGTGNNFYANVGTGDFIAVLGSSSSTDLYTASGTNLVYATSGDNVALVGSGGSNAIVAGAGNETLNAAYNSGGPNYLFNGSGSDVDVLNQTGAAVVYAGSGSSTMIGGTSGIDYYVFAAPATSPGTGTDYIYNWNSNDLLLLAGYGTTAQEAAAVADGTSSGGILTITLPDKTSIQIIGVSSVASAVY
jgi:hypothetical protein